MLKPIGRPAEPEMIELSESSQQFAQQGIAALRRGNYRAAREFLEQATTAGQVDASIWLPLAFARARLGENQAALDAVDKALQIEPHNLRALLFKGEHLAQLKQTRKALVFYQAALKLARQQTPLPADVQSGLRRAQASCQRFAGEYESYLLEQLAKRGFRRGESSLRFEQSLDIAFGKREVYYQQPTRFYFPGLPQIQFYDRESFPWLDQIEAATEKIRAELLEVMQDIDNFTPYLVSDSNTVQINDSSNVDNPDWGAFYFYQEGKRVEKNAQRCPQTMQALEAAPLPQVRGSTPHALYSRLAAKTKIPPHVGLINTRLICHLPLVVPENCGGLRCGNQVQHWTEGKAYVFDDSIEHEAWNDSDEDRVVLLFDIWRPELSAEERELVSAMLQAVQSYESEDDGG
ncbi:MAG: aspartyl/asparaginyl beta-hydroxylase domain-containing protein [Pseudomonadales bacterium]